jgi:hypothetical protein
MRSTSPASFIETTTQHLVTLRISLSAADVLSMSSMLAWQYSSAMFQSGKSAGVPFARRSRWISCSLKTRSDYDQYLSRHPYLHHLKIQTCIRAELMAWSGLQLPYRSLGVDLYFLRFDSESIHCRDKHWRHGGRSPRSHFHEVLTSGAVSNVGVELAFRVSIDSPCRNLLFTRFRKLPRNQSSARPSLIEQVPWRIRNLRSPAHAQLVG